MSIFFRIGEATVPGPAQAVPTSFIEKPPWALGGTPEFCIGTGNPSGLCNKLHTLDHMPRGWFHLAETQCSKHQQSQVQGYLKALSSRTGRTIRSCMGAPAPLRSGSVSSGAWTGVMNYGDCHLRQVPTFWPSGEYQSGRAMTTVAHIGGMQITSATVYCPARGPTFTNAPALAEELLQPISEAIVFGRSGPRIICGDFNCEPGSLQQMKVWQSLGWVEAQSLIHQWHDITPTATCKGATMPDQIWCSPEIIKMISNIAVWNVYPDHAMLLIGLQLLDSPRASLQWTLPGHIPWSAVNLDRWTSETETGSVFPASVWPVGCQHMPSTLSVDGLRAQDSTTAFRQWSSRFDQSVNRCMQHDTATADRSYFGRGQLTQPKLRSCQMPVPKHSRPGEVEQSCGFLNRSTARWYKQLRRLQSYLHAARSSRAQENFADRAAQWNSIKRAAGFECGFIQWWLRRPIQLQGTPRVIPEYPPDEVIAALIFDDFQQNYRRYESWQLQRRRDSCQSKLLTTTRGLFAATRKPPTDTLDCLEDKVSQKISVVDAHRNLVSVPEAFPSQDVTHWTLQDQPAIVKVVDSHYEIQSDLLLVDNQTLSCHVAVHDTGVIHDRLLDLWSPRWNRHAEVPLDRWEEICSFAQANLRGPAIDLPPITAQDFRRAVSSFKSTAATGPCGWSLQDLKHLTDPQVQAVVDFYAAIEAGAPWPTQWTTGIIHCLQKRASSTTVDGFRPIYRIFAGIRSGQILAQLSQRAETFQTGFVRGRQSSDVWYMVGVSLEVALAHQTPLFGVVGDIVKAYNCLPRHPCFVFLQCLGLPDWFCSVWRSHLAQFQRFFSVNGSLSVGVGSCTGFPEGCPLSCAAMTALDTAWHWFQKIDQPRAVCLSYVDNLEILCDSASALHDSVLRLRSFVSLLDLELDSNALYTWSSCTSGRKALKTLGYTVSLGARDLGGQLSYSAQHRNRVLTDRIDGVKPYFQKLRTCRLPTQAKLLNVRQVLWPRALHGCEAVPLGKSHITTLRSGAMKSVNWDRGGASSLIRFGLLFSESDPAWYQLKTVLSTFRRQLRLSPVVADWWKLFCAAATGFSNGPFGKLQEVLHAIGLTVDEAFQLWFTDKCCVTLTSCSDDFLERVLLRNFRRAISHQVRQRAGFEDLHGFDYRLTTGSDRSFQPHQVEQLNVVRDGSFITNSYRGKYDASKSTVCTSCGVRDSREHKYTDCVRYAAVRAQHGALLEQWHSWPPCVRFYGLVPENPWADLLDEAFSALPSLIEDYEYQPSGYTWHLFTDGTCSDPTDPEAALAAWSVVWDRCGSLACGYLEGPLQTITRAEITAVLSAVRWIRGREGILHVWIDSQIVVDHLRELLAGTSNPRDYEHSDLWTSIAEALAATSADVIPHKVTSHLYAQDCQSPLEDWAHRWNAAADFQADLANQKRPFFFMQVWSRFQEYRTCWKNRVQLLTRYHVDVATQDCQPQQNDDSEGEDTEEVSQLFDFVWCQNTHEVSVQLEVWHESHGPFRSDLGSSFDSVASNFLSWLAEVDSSAAQMRLVSLLEIFVAHRVYQGGSPLCLIGGDVDQYTAITFARDFSFFKKVFQVAVEHTAISVTYGQIDLASPLRIFPIQKAVWLGWPSDLAQATFAKISAFVGRRPITSSQGFSRPWHL